jgi:hypothetical protein
MASVKDMHDWGLVLDTCRRIGEADYLDLVRNDCKPKTGDVLIAKDGSYLKHTFVVGGRTRSGNPLLNCYIAPELPDSFKLLEFYFARPNHEGSHEGVCFRSCTATDYTKRFSELSYSSCTCPRSNGLVEACGRDG